LTEESGGFYPGKVESFLVLLAAAALVFPIAFLAVPPAVSAWRRRHETRRGFKPKRRKAEKLVIPSADETAASVERFHEAVRRSELADFLRSD